MIEYVLLLIIALTIGIIVTSRIVGRADNPGFLMDSWNRILQAVGSDTTD